MLNYKPVSITSFDLNLLLYQNISDIYRLRLSHWKILRFESGLHYFQPTVWCCYLWRNNASWMWKESYKSECWESFWGKMPCQEFVWLPLWSDMEISHMFVLLSEVRPCWLGLLFGQWLHIKSLVVDFIFSCLYFYDLIPVLWRVSIKFNIFHMKPEWL